VAGGIVNNGPFIWGASGPRNLNNPSAGYLQSDASGNITSVAGGGSGYPAWAASTAYTVGTIVSYSWYLMICTTAHTSSAAFETDATSGYWAQINQPTKDRNLMFYGSNFESNTLQNWNTFSITGYTAGTLPTTTAPTAGGGSSITLTDVNSGGTGTYSLKASSALNTAISAGQGFYSPAIRTPAPFRGKTLNLKFQYIVNSGSANITASGTSTNSFYVLAWDTTNSTWIAPTGVYTIGNSTTTTFYDASFPIASNTLSVQIAIFCANTTGATGTTAVTVDDFYLGLIDDALLQNSVGLTQQSSTPASPVTGAAKLYTTTSNVPAILSSAGNVMTANGFNLTSQSANYTANYGDFVRCTASITVTLPTAVGFQGSLIAVGNSFNNSSSTITINTTSSQTVAGYASGVITLGYRDTWVFISNGTNWSLLQNSIYKAPTQQIFTSGSGTYTTPPLAKYIRVRMVGGGGGGAGAGSGSGSPNGGGNTTFGNLTANGGTGNGGYGAASGSGASIGSGFIGTTVTGGYGSGGTYASGNGNGQLGGVGGGSYFGGGAGVQVQAVGYTSTTYGSGGGGGSMNASFGGNAGGGGGAGGFIHAISTGVPSSTYSYSVGSGGAGATAGTNGFAGGAGGPGYIEVTEYYS